MSKTTNKFSPGIRARAVRMVLNHEGELLFRVDLSRIYAAPITRLGCLAFEGQGAFAPQS
jgi:hypothetical protein